MFRFVFAFISVLACTQSALAGLLPGRSAALNSEGYEYVAPTNAVTSERLISAVTSAPSYGSPIVHQHSSYSEANSYSEPISHHQVSAPLSHNAYSSSFAVGGQYTNGQYSNGQLSNDKYSNGQYSNGQYSNGQLSNDKYSNGQHSNAQHSNAQHSNGQYSNGQYSNAQHSNGQYSNGQYSNGQYSNGKLSNGQYSNGRNANGRKVARTNSYTAQKSAPLVAAKGLYSAPLTDASGHRTHAATYDGYNGELSAW